MGMPETMGEYLVKLSADIDTNSFNAATAALNQLMSALKKVQGLAVAAAAVSGFVAIGKAAVDTIKSVAAADMQFKRLATQMWITKDSAKALSTAMKVMGVSQEDLAWIPELREQFFRLRKEMNELATPVDADRQLKWIREISYDVQSLQVKLKMLKEWVAYYLIKYLKPFIKEFQDFIRWLNDKLGKNMPQIAKKIAEFLGHVVSVGLSAIKVLKMVIGGVYRFIEGLPASVKKWGAIFATIGAFIMASPFGRLIAVLGGVMLLMEDFIYYMNGWNSSKTLAPMWEKLLRFMEGDTLSEFIDKVTGFLDTICTGLDTITKNFIEGFDWEGVFNSWGKGVDELFSGVTDLFDAIAKLFGKIETSTGSDAKAKQKTFWSSVGTYISDALKGLGDLAGMVGKIMAAIALCLRGDFAGAASLLGVAIKGLAGMTPMGRLASGLAGLLSSSEDEKERSNTIMAALMKNGLSKNGAAGLIGNLKAESELDSTSVESGWLHPLYLERIKNGLMSREDFINDGVGFGLAQWTSKDRKEALWDYAAERGVSIDDMGMQVEFLLNELRAKYQDVYAALCRGDISIKEASDTVLHQFEKPRDQSEAVENLRAGYGMAAHRDAPENPVNGGGGGSFGVSPTSPHGGGGGKLDEDSDFAVSPTSYAESSASDEDSDLEVSPTSYAEENTRCENSIFDISPMSYAAGAVKNDLMQTPAAYGGGNTSNSFSSNVTVNVYGNGDADQIAKRVAQENNTFMARFGRGYLV